MIIKPSFKLVLLFLLLISLGSKSQNTNGIATSIDSNPIYYRTYGKGKPLLIINGGPGMNSDGFEYLATRFAKNNMAIIYDQRGTGKSVLKKADSSTITMKLMVEDIESLRKHLKIKKWSVLGHSFGGMLVSYYATLYPQSIEKIIMSSSGGIDLGLMNYVSESINSKLSKGALDSLSFFNNKINNGDTSYNTRLERGKKLAPAYVYNPMSKGVIAVRLTQGNGLINQLVWDDLQKINFDCKEKLKSFTKPVLIIQGKEDIIKPETAELAKKSLKNSKIVLMDNCIHYGWLDNPIVYFKEINSFLSPK